MWAWDRALTEMHSRAYRVVRNEDAKRCISTRMKLTKMQVELLLEAKRRVVVVVIPGYGIKVHEAAYGVVRINMTMWRKARLVSLGMTSVSTTGIPR